jgi:galactonate dehydratase
VIQEQSLGIHYNTTSDLLDYLVDRTVFAYRDGYVDIPKGAGLGIQIDEDKVREAAQLGHRWRNPVWRNEDGTVAEW